MALTIEDGTLVAGADSFATVAEARTYALARGVTLSAVDAEVEVLLRKGADFLQSLEDRFKGSRTSAAQSLPWPRSGVTLFDDPTELAETVIPPLLIKGQCQLALDAVSVDLQPTGSGREVIRTKVDVIETEYSPRKSGTITPELNKALSILQPLFNSAGAFGLSTLRV